MKCVEAAFVHCFLDMLVLLNNFLLEADRGQTEISGQIIYRGFVQNQNMLRMFSSLIKQPGSMYGMQAAISTCALGSLQLVMLASVRPSIGLTHGIVHTLDVTEHLVEQASVQACVSAGTGLPTIRPGTSCSSSSAPIKDINVCLNSDECEAQQWLKN